MINTRVVMVVIIIASTFLMIVILLWRQHTRRVVEIPAYLNSYWDVIRERRRSVRFEKHLPVTCSMSESAENVHHIFSKNISGEGICLLTPEMLPEGIVLDLKIEIPDDDPVEVKGEVVWVKESQKKPERTQRVFEAGVKFTRIDPQDVTRLGIFLATCDKSLSC